MKILILLLSLFIVGCTDDIPERTGTTAAAITADEPTPTVESPAVESPPWNPGDPMPKSLVIDGEEVACRPMPGEQGMDDIGCVCANQMRCCVLPVAPHWWCVASTKCGADAEPPWPYGRCRREGPRGRCEDWPEPPPK